MKNQTALVTGASGGIGKAIAEQFAKDGYDLVISARNLAQLQSLASSWQQTYKVKVIAIAADLSQPQAAQELYAEVKRQQIVITYLVNNAGYGLFGLFDKLDHAQQMAMLQLNIMSLTSLAKLFLPDLLAQRGRMMNVASTAAFQPGPLDGGILRQQSLCFITLGSLGRRVIRKGRQRDRLLSRPDYFRLSGQSLDARFWLGQR